MTSAAPRQQVARLDALTGLRGLAAWLVVVFHARLLLTDWLPAPVMAPLGHGYLAVDLFFILSGFVMWLNYGPRLRAEGLRGAPAFWWRRVARIWPLHIAILAAMICFAMLLLATGRDMAGYPLAELPLHILLVQNWGLTEALSWNHPAWSISTEMGAYLLFPFLVLAARWENWRTGALVLVILACAILLHLIFRAAGEASLGGQIHRLGLMRCLMEFAIGVMLANIWQLWRGKAAAPAMLAIAACGLIGVSVSGLAPSTFALPLAFAALVLALALDNSWVSRLLASPALRWLGDVSYATYLAHFPLLIVWKLVFLENELALSPFSFAAYCGVLLALSAGLFFWLEKPAQRAMNRALPLFQRPRAQLD